MWEIEAGRGARLLRSREIFIRHPKFWAAARYECYTPQNIVIADKGESVLRLLSSQF